MKKVFNNHIDFYNSALDSTPPLNAEVLSKSLNNNTYFGNKFSVGDKILYGICEVNNEHTLFYFSDKELELLNQNFNFLKFTDEDIDLIYLPIFVKK